MMLPPWSCFRWRPRTSSPPRMEAQFPQRDRGAVPRLSWKSVNLLHLASALVVLLAGPLLIRARISALGSIPSALWAEDGNTFYNQAAQLGFTSIWTPYAGYLHFYERLFALLGVRLGLGSVPYVFLLGWVLAFAITAAVIVKRAVDSGIGYWVGSALVTLVAAQPASGEAFFTLTNSQWVLGAALSVYLLVPGQAGRSYIALACLALGCLNGLYSVILVPALIVRALVFRDWRPRTLLYGIVLGCAAIQAVVLARSGRLASEPLDPDLSRWMTAIAGFFMFGGETAAVYVAATVFWLLWLVALILAFRAKDGQSHQRSKVSLLLFLGASLFMGASFYAYKHLPSYFNPVGLGDRYYFIPYTLVFFGALLVGSQRKPVAALMLACLAVVCAAQIRPILRQNVQFPAYAALAKTKDSLIVPLAPVWPQYPGWHLSYRGTGPTQTPKKEALPLIPVGVSGLQAEDTKGRFVSTSLDPQLVFHTHRVCFGSRYVGIEAELEREQAGWAQLFWDSALEFNEAASLRRYFPAGRVTMQFAFLNPADDLMIRFDPLELTGPVELLSLQIICLSD